MAIRKKTAEKKALVLGIGNVLMTDEGLGVRALEALRDGYRPLPGIRCVDGGTMGLSLLEIVKKFPSVIVIDAVKSGSKPGTILTIRGKDIPASAGIRPSAHGLGVKELMALTEFEGFHPDVTVIGMEPKDVSPGLGLTPLVKKQLPSLVKIVIKELQKLGVTLEENKSDA